MPTFRLILYWRLFKSLLSSQVKAASKLLLRFFACYFILFVCLVDPGNAGDLKSMEQEYVPKSKRITSLSSRLMTTTSELFNKFMVWPIAKVVSDLKRTRPPKTRTKFKRSKNWRPYRFRHVPVRKKRLLGPFVAMLSLQAASSSRDETLHFDTDSFPIKVDNCSSCSMTHEMKDFVDLPRPVRGVVRGLGGNTVQATHVGTIKWKFEDDDGRVHSILLPGSVYVP